MCLLSGSSPGTFDPAKMSPIIPKSKKSLFISTDSMEKKESWYGSTMFPIKCSGSPEPTYCTGKCRDNPSEEGRPSPDVVSVVSFKRS